MSENSNNLGFENPENTAAQQAKLVTVEPEVEELQLATMSRSVVESYIFSTGKQNLSIYSERLLMLLVRAAQSQTVGLKFSTGEDIRQVSIGPLGEALVEIDAKELLNGSNKNYTQAKNAVMELLSKVVSHERPKMKNGEVMTNELGETIYEFEAHTLLNNVWINHKPGSIIVNVNRATWEAILDFSKGFRRYDLKCAMKLSRTYSLRLYKMLSNQQNPITYSIEELRGMWGLQDKYKQTKDFIKNTIESAKEELDAISAWTFDYQPVYSSADSSNRGRSGRKSITAITFFPKRQLKHETTTEVARQLPNPADMLGRTIVNRLVKNLGFSIKEIRANQVLFQTARKHMNLEDFLIEITPKASRAQNPQGYVINSIKTRLKEHYGIVVKRNAIVQQKTDGGVPSHRAASTTDKSYKHKSVNELLRSKGRAISDSAVPPQRSSSTGRTSDGKASSIAEIIDAKLFDD